MSTLGLLLALAVTSAGKPPVPLWQLAPFDRVTLSNGDVHDIDPERIPPGTDFSEVEDDTYVGQPGLPPRNEIRRPVLYRIRRQEDGRQYDLYGRNVDKVETYEALLLEEANRLLRLDRFDETFKYLEHLTKYNSKWPGLEETWVQFLYREGVRLKLAGTWEPAFWSLVEAARKQAGLSTPVELTPPINEQIDDLVDKWIQSCLSRQDYAEARRVIARVEASYPESKVAARRKAEIQAQSHQLLNQAKTAEAAEKWSDARNDLEAAAAMTPADAEIRSAIETLYHQHGHLRVGVEQAASFFGGPADWSSADWRAAELVHLPIMQSELVGDEIKWTSQILRSVKRPDQYLNRRAILDLRTGLRWPGDGKEVSIVDIQRLLADTCRPGSPYYHPALARLVVRLDVEGPQRLTIDFDRPQPRPEAWLTLPMVRLANARATNGQVSGLGPFSTTDRTSAVAVYTANPYFAVQGKPIIHQVTEQLLPSAADRLRAIEEARIDLATDLPPRQWKNAAKIKNVNVVSFKIPTVYVLQFNFNQRILRDRTLRRAMAIALDHRRILKHVGFDGEDESLLTTAPWPAGTFGYDASIKPRERDIVLARLLTAAVKKKYTTLPVLRLVHDATEADRLACQEIARDLQAIGLRLNLVEFDPSAPVSPLAADLRYAALTVQDPIYDTMTFLMRDNPSLAEYASPWLRQLLVELVEVPNLSSARELLPRLHRVLYDDVAVIPLWQYRKRMAVSDRVKGMVESPRSTYENIVNWSVTPGYPPVYWSAEQQTVQNP